MIFYVYEHWRPDTGACFYVGKGKKNRAWAMAGRSLKHRAVVSKLVAAGLVPDVRIVARDLTNDQAIAIEVATIKKYGRKNLCNLTDGGEGCLGWVPSEETRKRIGSKNKGRHKNAAERKKISEFWRGRPKSALHRERIAAALIGNKNGSSEAVSASNKRRAGKKVRPRSKEHAANLSVALKGRSCWNKGKKMSAESRAKMSASAKRRCERAARKIRDAA